jgi:hypothetical protein
VQHRAVLGALGDELKKLKVENRDLKFRLVMRDTATPKAKARPSGESAGTVTALRKELAELQEKNSQMERARALDRAEATVELEVGLKKVNTLNFELLSEVAALRHELQAQTQHSQHAHPSRRRSSNDTSAKRASDPLSQSLPAAVGRPGLKDYGISKTGQNNQPRLLNRSRASGDINGRTRRKLVPVPQLAALSSINVNDSLSVGHRRA